MAKRPPARFDRKASLRRLSQSIARLREQEAVWRQNREVSESEYWAWYTSHERAVRPLWRRWRFVSRTSARILGQSSGDSGAEPFNYECLLQRDRPILLPMAATPDGRRPSAARLYRRPFYRGCIP